MLSKVKNLTKIVIEIETIINKHFGVQRSAVAIAFVLSPKYDRAHWATNLRREDGIFLFKNVAKKMTA